VRKLKDVSDRMPSTVPWDDTERNTAFVRARETMRLGWISIIPHNLCGEDTHAAGGRVAPLLDALRVEGGVNIAFAMHELSSKPLIVKLLYGAGVLVEQR
jgi:hypothetical protein